MRSWLKGFLLLFRQTCFEIAVYIFLYFESDQNKITWNIRKSSKRKDGTASIERGSWLLKLTHYKFICFNLIFFEMINVYFYDIYLMGLQKCLLISSEKKR